MTHYVIALALFCDKLCHNARVIYVFINIILWGNKYKAARLIVLYLLQKAYKYYFKSVH